MRLALRALALAAACALATPLAGRAQSPFDASRFALELRAGAAIGQVTASAGGAEWRPGPAWSAGASVAVYRFAEVTLGYGRSGFGCETGFCESNAVRFTAAGLDAGVRVQHGVGWARVGAVRHSLRSRWTDAGQARSGSSKAAFGWEAGGGVAFALSPSFQLTPGLRYARVPAAFDDGPADSAGYLTGDLGVRFTPR